MAIGIIAQLKIAAEAAGIKDEQLLLDLFRIKGGGVNRINNAVGNLFLVVGKKLAALLREGMPAECDTVVSAIEIITTKAAGVKKTRKGGSLSQDTSSASCLVTTEAGRRRASSAPPEESTGSEDPIRPPSLSKGKHKVRADTSPKVIKKSARREASGSPPGSSRVTRSVSQVQGEQGDSPGKRSPHQQEVSRVGRLRRRQKLKDATSSPPPEEANEPSTESGAISPTSADTPEDYVPEDVPTDREIPRLLVCDLPGGQAVVEEAPPRESTFTGVSETYLGCILHELSSPQVHGGEPSRVSSALIDPTTERVPSYMGIEQNILESAIETAGEGEDPLYRNPYLQTFPEFHQEDPKGSEVAPRSLGTHTGEEEESPETVRDAPIPESGSVSPGIIPGSLIHSPPGGGAPVLIGDIAGGGSLVPYSGSSPDPEDLPEAVEETSATPEPAEADVPVTSGHLTCPASPLAKSPTEEETSPTVGVALAHIVAKLKGKEEGSDIDDDDGALDPAKEDRPSTDDDGPATLVVSKEGATPTKSPGFGIRVKGRKPDTPRKVVRPASKGTQEEPEQKEKDPSDKPCEKEKPDEDTQD